MTTHKIVFLDRATLPPDVVIPELRVAHEWVFYPHTDPQQVISRCEGAQAVVTNKAVIDRQVIQALPALRYIGVAATGVNVVDLQACAEAGITVCNAEHYGSDSVAEHTFMLMLMLARQMKPYQAALRRGDWQKSNQFCFFLEPIRNLKGLTLGLVGTGDIAKTVAGMACAFGMRVVFHSPSGRSHVEDQECLTLEQLLGVSDVVSIHCPLNQRTEGLIGSRALAQMKRSALLINTARGSVVDTKALLLALRNKIIAGAALDVLPQEPPSAKDPVFNAALEMENLLLTPHIAWTSQSAIKDLVSQLCERLDAFFSDREVPNLAQSAE